jgi:uncharacterized protein (UPF0332 family)
VLAGFHAAQALIAERTGKALRTHRGVHSEFARLSRIEPSIDADLRAFPSRTFVLKAVADYDAGGESAVSRSDVATAIDAAERLTARIERLIADPGSAAAS